MILPLLNANMFLEGTIVTMVMMAFLECSRRNSCDYGANGVSRSNNHNDDDVSKTKDVDDGNSGSNDGDDGVSGSNDGDVMPLVEEIQTITDTPTTNSDEARMMGLRAMGYELGARSWER